MLRFATRVVCRRRPLFVASRPASSSTAHDDHQQDDFVYPNQGFGAPIWRKTLVAALGAALFYEYLGAPSDSQLPWLLEEGSEESSTNTASLRAARAAVLLEERQLVRSATRSPMYRTRNPEEFNHLSPYKNAVGMHVPYNK